MSIILFCKKYNMKNIVHIKYVSFNLLFCAIESGDPSLKASE